MPIIGKRPSHQHLHDDWFLLEENLVWRDPKTHKTWRVDAPFEWDKGSVMEFVPRMLVPHGDEMTYPSALHDLFYKNYRVSRREADRIFRDFLREEFDRSGDALGGLKSWAAWTAVRLNLAAEFRWVK